MKYLKVANWDRFQHYKDRNPPWIKLHNTLLEDYEFTNLSDATKSHLLSIWMLASRTDNKIPNDENWISCKIGAKSKVNLKPLFEAGFIVEHDASKALASCYGDGTVTVPLGEKRREEESRPVSQKFIPPTVEEVAQYCAQRKNGIDAQKFVSHYEASGWKRGNTKIKNWKACVITWEKNNSDTKPTNGTNGIAGDIWL